MKRIGTIVLGAIATLGSVGVGIVDGFDLDLLIEFFGQNVPAAEEGS